MNHSGRKQTSVCPGIPYHSAIRQRRDVKRCRPFLSFMLLVLMNMLKLCALNVALHAGLGRWVARAGLEIAHALGTHRHVTGRRYDWWEVVGGNSRTCPSFSPYAPGSCVPCWRWCRTVTITSGLYGRRRAGVAVEAERWSTPTVIAEWI
jgi:hypothetical protein